MSSPQPPEQPVTVPRRDTGCALCEGNGYLACSTCQGFGDVPCRCPQCTHIHAVTCPECQGRRYFHCDRCAPPALRGKSFGVLV